MSQGRSDPRAMVNAIPIIPEVGVRRDRIPPGVAGGRILLVDDDPDAITIMTTTLESVGCTDVHAIRDARDAVESFRRIQPDLVLLDLNMPHKSGFEILAELEQAIPPDDHVPIIVLTADGTREARSRALALGATDYLTRPVDRTEAVLRIGNHLRTRQLHQRVHGRAERLETMGRAQRLEIRRLVQVLDEIDTPLFIYEDGAERIAHANPAGQRTVGHDRPLPGEPPDDRSGWAQVVHHPAARDVVEGRAEVARFEARLPSPQGRRKVPVEVLLQSLEGDHDRMLFALVADVSAAKSVQAALRRAADREHQAADELRRLDQSKDQFLRAMSHELRTPLSIVLAGSQTVRMRFDQLSHDRCVQLLERLEANASRLSDLMLDLMEVAVQSSGRTSGNLHRVRVDEVVADAVATFDLRGRDVELDLDPRDGMVDVARLKRLVHHLLDNVVRFTPAHSPVSVRLRDESDRLRLVVQDAGPGIAQEMRGSAFEAFWQGPDAMSANPGTGIGLTLVRAHARAHGGDAWIEEAPGGGTAVHVTLLASSTPQ